MQHCIRFLAGTSCGHLDEDIFDDELMTGFVNNVSRGYLLVSCYSLEFPVDAAETLWLIWSWLLSASGRMRNETA